jgi:hypothetical protein
MLPTVTVSGGTPRREMSVVDQYARIVLGLELVAFAFQDGLSIQGWHWVGLAGFVLLALLSSEAARCTACWGCNLWTPDRANLIRNIVHS